MPGPGRNGTKDDIVLGFDQIEGYLQTSGNPYFGSTMGRVANRIRRGSFQIGDGDPPIQLDVNDGPNHLHGGFKERFILFVN